MWHVLYTKPRNEKKLAELLAGKGVTVYCPVQETVKQWSDRRKKIQEPLFRSYIFVELEDYEREQTAVLATPGAVRFLWWQGRPGIVREEEIEAIRQLLEDYKGARITVDFNEGDTVSVAEGALKERTGRILRIKGGRALLHLPSLGWNVTAELPVQALDKKR